MNQLINASAHDTGLPDKSIHCIVTSPPYFGLRSYAGEQDIEWPIVEYAPMAGLPQLTIPAMRCGLGAEPTPEAFIGHLMLVMREMWRVLRDDGVCWVNLGDSYNGSGGAGGDYGPGGIKEGQPKFPGRKISALKPKDLIMIPARFALAAQADGWYLRSDIIWHKPNPMPESVTDRPTKAHEYVYLLTKSEKYFYDAEAVKEANADPDRTRFSRGHKLDDSRNDLDANHRFANMVANGRNRRSVWTIATSPYPGSHFATWPQALVEPMIKAGTSAHGVCGLCGAPWRRMVEKGAQIQQHWAPGTQEKAHIAQGKHGATSVLNTGYTHESITTGWSPTCTCNAGDAIPATVLDPFNGSGTSGVVAMRLGRSYIGIDISAEYLTDLAPQRMSNVQMEMVTI